jgi:signal transduction histidine kinase
MHVGRYLAAGLGVVLMLLVLIVGVAVYSAVEVDDSARGKVLDDAFPLRTLARDVVVSMLNEETGVRGFLITGRAASLEPYRSGHAAVAKDLHGLQPHLAAHPPIARLVGFERTQIAGLDAYFTAEIALVRRGPAGQRLAQSRVLAGKSRFDAFRQTAGRVDGAAVRLVDRAERSQRDTFHRMVVLVSVLGAVALVLGVAIAIMLLRVIGANARRLERAAAEREQRAAELARSNAHLQEYAYASHDLSEPLRTVSGFAQLLGRRYEGRLDSDADEFIGFIVDGANRMQRLISDLLDYSHAGREELRLAQVDTAAVVQRVLQTMRAPMAETGATVAVCDLPMVTADEGQLERVFLNLVGNALKFVAGGPARVDVSASQRDDEWCFCVADHGIGITPEHTDRVFRLFQRLNPRDQYPGTGVGLAVTKTIVERHGGRVWRTPNEPTGSRFWFTIPVRTGVV